MNKIIEAMRSIQEYCTSPNCTNCMFYRPPEFFADNTCMINNPRTWIITKENLDKVR